MAPSEAEAARPLVSWINLLDTRFIEGINSD
jgi:hypothetical protein